MENNTKWLAFCIFYNKLLSHPLSYLGLREVKFVPWISKKDENQCVGCRGLAHSPATLAGLSLMLKTPFPRLLCGSKGSAQDLGTAIRMHMCEIWVARRERQGAGHPFWGHQTVTEAAGFGSQQSWWQIPDLLSSFLIQQLPVQGRGGVLILQHGRGSSCLIGAALQRFGEFPPFPPLLARVNSVGCNAEPPPTYPSCVIPTWCSFHGFSPRGGE